jgi:hypothetical protein
MAVKAGILDVGSLVAVIAVSACITCALRTRITHGLCLHVHALFTCNREPTAWFEARTSFARSAAVWSGVGHVVGLGDRCVLLSLEVC